MDIKGKQPSTWQDYERGGRNNSFSSTGSHVQWDDAQLEDEQAPGMSGSPARHEYSGQDLRRRR